MNILIKDHYTEEALDLLKAKEDTQLFRSDDLAFNDPNREEIDILLIRSRTKLSADLLSSAPQLQLIVTATSGYDHIDLAYCKAHRIKVAHTPEANRDSAAELAVMLMLNSLRHGRSALEAIGNGKWRPEVPRGNTMAGRKLGIIGLGRVGSRVAELARSFRMDVSAFDPYQPDEQFQTFGVRRLGYRELLAQSDVVSFHVPLTEETQHMLDEAALAGLAEGAVVINASRGGVIDEAALHQALLCRRVAAAGLDVFEQEPLPASFPLRDLPNVFMTTHMGAYTYEAIDEASRQAVQAVCLFLDGCEIPCRLV